MDRLATNQKRVFMVAVLFSFKCLLNGAVIGFHRVLGIFYEAENGLTIIRKV